MTIEQRARLDRETAEREAATIGPEGQQRIEQLEAEVRELRAALVNVGIVQKPEPCGCAMAKWQRSQGLPIDCGHERDPGQGPTVMERRRAELATIDAS